MIVTGLMCVAGVALFYLAVRYSPDMPTDPGIAPDDPVIPHPRRHGGEW